MKYVIPILKKSEICEEDRQVDITKMFATIEVG